MRRVENEQARPLVDLGEDLVHVEIEVGLFRERIGHRAPAHELNHRIVNRKARIGVENLILGIYERQNDEKEDGLGARRDDDFRRIHADVAAFRHVFGNCLAKFSEPGGRPVVRPTLMERLHRRLDNVGGGRKVRLADFEVNNFLAASLELAGTHQHFEGALGPEARHPVREAKFDRGGQHRSGGRRDRRRGGASAAPLPLVSTFVRLKSIGPLLRIVQPVLAAPVGGMIV